MEKKVIALSEICEVITKGTTPTTLGYEFQKEGINFLKIECFDEEGNFIPDKIVYISEECDERLKRSQLKQNDILFSIAGAIGKVAIVSEDMLPANTNQALAIIRINRKDIFIPYIKLILISNIVKEQYERQKQGVAQLNLSLKNIGDLKIPICSLDCQVRYADLFENMQKLISMQKAQLKAYDDLIKSRFVELFGDPKWNPNGFEIVPFSECIEYIGDIGSNGANKIVVEHLDMKDIEDYALMVRFLNFTSNDFNNNVKYISKESYDFFKKSQIFGGELIFCKIGSAGLNYVMPYLNRPVSLGLNQIMIRINEKTLMPYLYRYLNTSYGKHLIDGCVNGAVTKSITKGALKQIPILIPPIDRQRTFVAFVADIDKLKVETQKSLDETQQLFDSLMQKYFG